MSYHIMQAAAGYGGYGGGLGGLFFDEGKAFWRVMDATETLSSIATKVYGTVTAQTDIYNANPQGRWWTTAPSCPEAGKVSKPCWGWYKVGTILELPKIPGLPDPVPAAEKADIKKEPEGTTIVDKDGGTKTIGTGGKVVKNTPAPSKAGMSTASMVGIGVGAVALIGIIAVAAKRKKEGQPMGPRTPNRHRRRGGKR